MIDATKFPSVKRYLERLPEGLASYPHCQAKGSVLRSALDTAPIRLELPALPPQLAALVSAPPLPTEWMSEVQLNAILLAYQDRVTPELWTSWTFERNRALLRKSLYRVLFMVVSPDRLFNGLPQRWQTFRRGSELEIVENRPHVARLELRFPPRLHDERTLGAAAIAMRAACEAAGAKRCETRVAGLTDVRGFIDVDWE